MAEYLPLQVGGLVLVLRRGAASLFGAHPRMLLSSERLTELTARKDASTAEYTAMVAYLNAYKPANDHHASLTSVLGTGGVGTTFTVDDGSLFPTTQHQVRLGIELLSVTRSGNTFTVVSRGDAIGLATAVMSHAVGETVWEHTTGDSVENLAVIGGLLYQLGVTGYEDTARNVCSFAMTYFSPVDRKHNLNWIRWYGFHVALAYDWLHGLLPAADRAVYAELLRDTAAAHLASPKEGFDDGESYTRQSQFETGISSNIANGQLRSTLAMAIATEGDQPDAESQYAASKAKVDDWLRPAMVQGAFYGCHTPEGTEYVQTSWTQTLDVLEILATATGDDSYLADVEPWMLRWVQNVLHLTIPGAVFNTVSPINYTYGTGTAGSTTLTVQDSTHFSVGNYVYVAYAGDIYWTAIVAIDGLTWTLRDPLPFSPVDGGIEHQPRLLAYGDVENCDNYLDFPFLSEPQITAMKIMDRLRTSQATQTEYLQWWLQQQVGANLAGGFLWEKFIYYPAPTTPTDYRPALTRHYVTDHANAFGFASARTGWTGSDTWVSLLVGGETWDHHHCSQGDYAYWRKGVWLTRHVAGYGQNTDGPLTPVPENPWLGGRYQNTLLMNGHSGINQYYSQPDGAASLTRSQADTDYLYVRGDLSLNYRTYDGNWEQYPWSFYGLADDAWDCVRDFLYLKPDLVVFHDRTGYLNASTSPTRWIANFPAEPTLAGQRLTMTYGLQKLVQDVVLPTGATITKVEQASAVGLEYVAGWRTETISGVSASEEYGLQVLQGMDSGDSPATVTSLTTTNANVVQVGSTHVVGFVRGTSPTLPISYSYTGTPTHTLMGFAPSTAYHVVDSAGTVTISAATGTGDTTSSAAGLLIF